MARVLHLLKGDDPLALRPRSPRQLAAGDRSPSRCCRGAAVAALPAGVTRPARRPSEPRGRSSRADLRGRSGRRPGSRAASRRSAVPVLVEPRHLDGFSRIFSFEAFGSSANPGSSRHVAVQVGEAHRQRVDVRDTSRSARCRCPRCPASRCVTSGISTTTSPRTTAWQPRREWMVRPVGRVEAVLLVLLHLATGSPRPRLTITWHVVHAQEPPQLCSRWMSLASAMSSSEPGLPWSASGYFASSTSTVLFSGRNVTWCSRHHCDSMISSARRCRARP